MGTAPKKSGAAGALARSSGNVSSRESTELLIVEDNGPPLISPSEQPASRRPGSGPSYSCPGCGHVLRVSGLGRHRLYFDRPNALVTNGICPVCGRGLPGKDGL
jgi:hypothetical protein